MTLIKGSAVLIYEENQKITEIPMELNNGYLIKPFEKHRIKAIADCDIMEVSTPETGNTVRLEDDYARSAETENDRAENRKLK